MTPEERMEQLTLFIGNGLFMEGRVQVDDLKAWINRAITAAVEEEREACAKIAEDASANVENWHMKSIADHISIRIRMRRMQD